MGFSEAERHDLYTGLFELLGPERTETLMSALPIYDLDEVATKGDIVELRTELKGDIALIGAKVDTLQSELRATNKRLDRLIFAMIGGLTAIIVALAGVIINL